MTFRALVPHLAAAAVVCGCVALMLWQIDRAEDKRQRLAEVAAAPTLTLSDVSAETAVPARVRSSGRFEADRQLLLDNQVHQRQPGVQVFTPWRGDDGRLVLVNRGWAPWSDRRPPRPDPRPPAIQRIEGLLVAPPEVGLRLGAGSELDPDGWPNLVTYFDPEPLAGLYGPELLPQVIRLDPDHPAHLTGADWPVVTFGPERHLGYAFQWGLMAAVVVAIWSGLSWRAHRARPRRPDTLEDR
ncbi:SURF1 family protein [Wenzhouxiangella sp. XN79A]|uniref:SURF1 family protein n=1 Tax=Wenzhouxiangella sp. XN79A TaxID=2724193 RepID=UPI00144A7810|nr:SURF1 family protein [Wenzhouxiangella sp. XN79A]NKI36047.1 SURF1 family protein [Wenzhouxiangella sp. XN79A]